MLTLLLTCALAQFDGPITGWNKPIWDHPFPAGSRSWPELIDDFTGDGIPEILVLNVPEWNALEIFDGANGRVWFTLEPPGSYYMTQDIYREDLDGDGLPELILANDITFPGFGMVAVVHGGDGQLMWRIRGREDQDKLGKIFHLVDLTGDGLSDVYVASAKNGKAMAFSGITGDLLWRRYGLPGKFHSVAPDLDGDGIADPIIGGRLRLAAISGSTGAAIWNRTTTQIRQAENWQALYSDFNQDGTPDVLVLSPEQDSGSLSRNGVMEAVDGKTGALLWTFSGTASGMRLGTNALLEDRTGDGIPDLLSLFIAHPALLDGVTGSLIWQRPSTFFYNSTDELFLQDFNGDGFSDLLIPGRSTLGGAQDRLDLIDGRDGTLIWSRDAQLPKEFFSDLTLKDFDQDGVIDVLAVSPLANVAYQNDGLIRVFSGRSGQEIWQRSGGHTGANLGKILLLEELDSLPGVDFLVATQGNANDRKRRAINGVTGLDIWSQPYDLADTPVRDWGFADLDGDGRQDLVEIQYGGSYESVVKAFTSQDGSLVMTTPFTLPRKKALELRFSLPDLNGDGSDELFLLFPEPQGAFRAGAYSGADGGYTTGLNLSADQISISNGGTILTEVHFPPDQAGWDFQLLLSESGNQLTTLNGLWVPLTPGFWLTSTYMGTYPSGLLHNPIGTLDDAAKANIILDALPNQIAPAFAGTTMYLAVISAEPGMGWSFSSGSGAIQILP
jgi:hypothetical protein